jgi:hypothetical protein
VKLSFPSKTFLLGEYVVLEKGTALLLGHGPHFQAELLPGTGKGYWPFHPDSPAGRWLAAHPFPGTISFHDPHWGQGGFGASGAEYLAAWFSGHAPPTSLRERHDLAWAAWKESRIFPGSGADILTQAFAVGVEQPVFLAMDLGSHELESLILSRMDATISLFHTGKKMATHEALLKKPLLPKEEMAALVEVGSEALRNSRLKGFAQAINDYAALLRRLDLLAGHSAEALSKLPRERVLAAKGCGAMGADVLLVLHQGAELAPWAAEHSLKEISQISL